MQCRIHSSSFPALSSFHLRIWDTHASGSFWTAVANHISFEVYARVWSKLSHIRRYRGGLIMNAGSSLIISARESFELLNQQMTRKVHLYNSNRDSIFVILRQTQTTRWRENKKEKTGSCFELWFINLFDCVVVDTLLPNSSLDWLSGPLHSQHCNFLR